MLVRADVWHSLPSTAYADRTLRRTRWKIAASPDWRSKAITGVRFDFPPSLLIIETTTLKTTFRMSWTQCKTVTDTVRKPTRWLSESSSSATVRTFASTSSSPNPIPDSASNVVVLSATVVSCSARWLRSSSMNFFKDETFSLMMNSPCARTSFSLGPDSQSISFTFSQEERACCSPWSVQVMMSAHAREIPSGGMYLTSLMFSSSSSGVPP
mmetsp:Transcript_46824/g.111504  ORF Transcript_46824/g.111504 Transcript_46824/m.111504 type:complete len:212 (-) Transcript_46824:1992-2627(-)